MKFIELPRTSSQAQHKHYCKDSLVHPAKMAPMLAQWIVRHYTLEGDTVLDPMCGIGTTLVESVLLGRNAVGVEYEARFKELADRNLEGLAFLPNSEAHGRAVVLQGDSRKLVEILKESQDIDAIIFSPHYADTFNEKHTASPRGIIGKDKNFACFEGGYGKGKGNVGNLKHGEIDAVIVSPPFASSLAGSASDDTQKFKHGSAGKDYNEKKDDSRQLGNLDYGCVDAIITSPPFENKEPFQDKNFKLNGKQIDKNYAYTENKKDCTNLPNLCGETYLSEMKKIYEQCFLVLKQNGLMVLHTKNFVRKGQQVRLDEDTKKLCEFVGFKKIDYVRVKLAGYSFWIRNARRKHYLKNLDSIQGDPHSYYEDLQVFKKEVV